MRDSSFDNYIKQKINNHSSAVPDDMWERIVHVKESKRRWVFSWWNYAVLGTLLLATVLGGMQVANNLSGNKEHNLETKQNKNNGELVASKISEQNNSKPVENNALQTDNAESNLQADNTEIEINSSTPVSKQLKEVAPNTWDNQKGVTPSPKVIDKAVPIANTAFQSNEKNNSLKPTLKANIFSKAGYKNNGQLSLASSKNISEDVRLFQLKYLWRPSYYALHEGASFDNGKTIFLKPISNLHLPKIDCPSSGDPMLRDFNVEVYGSPDWVMKNTSVTKSSNAYYLTKKDSTETKQASFTFGIRISKAIGENMVLKTGVQYSQINQKFTYRNENERKLTTVITSRIIVRSPGDTVIVKDTSVTEMIGYSVRTSYNRLSSIDIPILLGYEWSFNDWKIGLNAGPIINISSWQEGETLDTNFLPMSFGKNKATVYKKNMGLGFYSGLSIIKCIGERTSLFAEPYFRYNLSSFTNSSSLVTEKYKVAGILLGVRYNLSKAKATH